MSDLFTRVYVNGDPVVVPSGVTLGPGEDHCFTKDPPIENVGPALLNNPACENLRRRFETWTATHPKTWDVVISESRRFVEAGRPFGMKMVWERVRYLLHFGKWEDGTPLPCMSEGAEEDGWRMDNNYTAYAARRLRQIVPGFGKLVQFREVKYKGEQAGGP